MNSLTVFVLIGASWLAVGLYLLSITIQQIITSSEIQQQSPDENSNKNTVNDGGQTHATRDIKDNTLNVIDRTYLDR